MAVFAVGTWEGTDDDSFRKSDWPKRNQSEVDEDPPTVTAPAENRTPTPGKWRGVGAEDSVRTMRQRREGFGSP